MKQPTVRVGSADAFSAKKRRYSSTAVGFPIRDDLSAYLQGISATFPTWERARLACTYVRDLGICTNWAKKNPLYSILSPDIHAADYADGARHGRENSHTTPLFVPAYVMGWRTVHHANTTLTTPCGASKLSKRQGNSLLVGLQLAWEQLASLLNSHWPTILLTLANHCRPIQLTLANHSRPIQLTLANHSRPIQLTLANHSRPNQLTLANHSQPTQPSQTNPTKPNQPTQPNQANPTKPSQLNQTQPTQPNQPNPTKPTQPNQTNQAKPTKPTLSSQTNPIQLT